MELSDVLRARTSCRSFAEGPVAADAVTAILEAGCAAPSPLNQQPWAFTVVTDPMRIAAVATHCGTVRDRLARDSGKEWVAKYDTSFIGRAPVLVAVAADPRKIGLGAFLGDTAAHLKAASACIQNMLLAVADRGLGSLWFTMYDRQELARMLGVGEELEIVGLLPIGIPGAASRQPPRRPAQEVTAYL
ncbi:MAG: nitroreductase family protein [Deferrisomatales bacterium]|nr:nitroreductase family protein [Deferrisomatales bacterium]